MFLFPSWERPVVGNLSDIVGPNWELGPNRSATLTGSVGVMGVWEPKKIAWEAESIHSIPRIPVQLYCESA